MILVDKTSRQTANKDVCLVHIQYVKWNMIIVKCQHLHNFREINLIMHPW